MKYSGVFQMGIQVKRNANNSFQGKKHLRTDRSLQDKRTFLQTCTKQAGSTEAVKSLGMVAWADGTRQEGSRTLKREWTASKRKSILICDSVKTPCGSRGAGRRQGQSRCEFNSSLLLPEVYTTENMYFLKFNVKCTVRISNQHLPSFLPTLHSSF